MNRNNEHPETCASCLHFYSTLGGCECRRFPPELILTPVPMGKLIPGAPVTCARSIVYRPILPEIPICGEYKTVLVETVE